MCQAKQSHVSGSEKCMAALCLQFGIVGKRKSGIFWTEKTHQDKCANFVCKFVCFHLLFCTKFVVNRLFRDETGNKTTCCFPAKLQGFALEVSEEPRPQYCMYCQVRHLSQIGLQGPKIPQNVPSCVRCFLLQFDTVSRFWDKTHPFACQ